MSWDNWDVKASASYEFPGLQIHSRRQEKKKKRQKHCAIADLKLYLLFCFHSFTVTRGSHSIWFLITFKVQQLAFFFLIPGFILNTMLEVSSLALFWSPVQNDFPHLYKATTDAIHFDIFSSYCWVAFRVQCIQKLSCSRQHLLRHTKNTA